MLTIHIFQFTGSSFTLSAPTTFLNPTLITPPTPPPTVFITKSVTSKYPTFKTSWRSSMQSERPKAAKVTRSTRRQEAVRFDDASHSPRKNPNGTKTTMFERVSTGPCPLFRNMREKSSVRLCPAACFMIPQYRIPTIVSSRNRPMKTVSPKAIAPYTEHFFRIRRMTRNRPLSFRPSASEWRSLPARLRPRFCPLLFPHPCSSTPQGTFQACFVASTVPRANTSRLKASVAYNIIGFCSQPVTGGLLLGTIMAIYVRDH